MDSVVLPKFPRLDKDIHVDVVIVGGGITGLTSAYLLVNEGLKVAVIEADRLLNGTTGHTTAKVTAQHGSYTMNLSVRLEEAKQDCIMKQIKKL